MRKALCLAAMLALWPMTVPATDWEDCARAYQTALFVTVQGCRVNVQNVPDLQVSETDGPLGFRYKRGRSKWCRVRAECPKFVCDGPLLHERGVYGAKCLSGKHKVVMTRVTASLKIGDAHKARWCATVPSKRWYIATSCKG